MNVHQLISIVSLLIAEAVMFLSVFGILHERFNGLTSAFLQCSDHFLLHVGFILIS